MSLGETNMTAKNGLWRAMVMDCDYVHHGESFYDTEEMASAAASGMLLEVPSPKAVVLRREVDNSRLGWWRRTWATDVTYVILDVHYDCRGNRFLGRRKVYVMVARDKCFAQIAIVISPFLAALAVVMILVCMGVLK